MQDLIVLYEDNHIIVTVKPQNIPTQADSSADPDFLTMVKDYVKAKYNKPGEAYIGLVHRLDRPTGGVMIFARTSKAAARLCEQIRQGDFEKKYLAVTVGHLRDRRGRMENYLVKDEKNNMVRIVPALIEGAKKAILDYNVLEAGDKLSLVDVKLITGRSHQIRVQMAGQGCPIFGDVKYGGDKVTKSGKLALWSYSLRLLHPVTKQVMVFKVFPPEGMPWNNFAVDKYINVVKPE